MTSRAQAPSGIEREPPPPEPPLLLTTTGDACAFTVLARDASPFTALPPGTRDLTAGDIAIHELVGSGDPPPRALVADRAGRTLWRHDLVADPSIPCELP
jgi:hypothetical protein